MAQEMKICKPSLIKELRSYVPIKISFTFTFVFIMLIVFLHVLCLSSYHRLRIIRNFVLSFLKSKYEKKFIPVLGVNSDDQSVIQNLSSKKKNRYHIILQSESNEMSIDTNSEIDIQQIRKNTFAQVNFSHTISTNNEISFEITSSFELSYNCS